MQHKWDDSYMVGDRDPRMAQAIVGLLEANWAYMSREDRVIMMKRYPIAVRMTSLKLDDPEREPPGWDEEDEQ